MNHSSIHPAVGIGHVHLRAADLEKAIVFYRDALGLGVMAYGLDFGARRGVPLALEVRVEEALGNALGLSVPVELAPSRTTPRSEDKAVRGFDRRTDDGNRFG